MKLNKKVKKVWNISEKTFVWKFYSKWNFAFITSEDIFFDTDIFVNKDNFWTAQTWDEVNFSITRPKTSKSKPEWRVISVVKKEIKIPSSSKIIEWEFTMTSTWFSFVDLPKTAQSEGKKWYFVHEKNRLNSIAWDRVKAYIREFNWREEAIIFEIIERSQKVFIGQFFPANNQKFWFVKLSDSSIWKDIFILKSASLWAEFWDKVWVKISSFEKNDKNPTWKIVKILGKEDDYRADIEGLILNSWVPNFFKQRVIKEAESLWNEVAQKDIKNRKDYRKELVYTIDWADAKDLDDAINISKNADWNYVLKVFIADVSHYVKEKSILDEEALERATSIYLPDRVIPMLPKALSNGLCSLHPNVDRLVLTCEMEIDDKWNVLDSKVFEGVINSKYRLTYDFVRAFLEGELDENNDINYVEDEVEINIKKSDIKKLKSLLLDAKNLYEIVYKNKKNLWILEFDFPESKIALDDEYKAVWIKKYERHFAHKMIEEFMILANENISRKFSDFPFLYRIHEKPLENDIESLRKTLNIFWYKLPYWDIEPKTFALLLNEIKISKRHTFLDKIILRSLTKASYSHENEGHFGLALNYYSHFTSPIRRYPDLQIHRIIKDIINKKIDHKRAFYRRHLKFVSKHTSELEVRAEKLEYDVIDMKKAEFMEDKIGEVYNWKISTMTNFWFFVELENAIEWLVLLENFPKNLRFNPELMQYEKGSEVIFRLWDTIKVECDKVDKNLKRVYFKTI